MQRVALFLALLLSGCGSSASSPGVGSIEAEADLKSSYVGLAFPMTDPKYTVSSLHFYDFKTGIIRRLLTGESGDPALSWTGDALYFFNRKSGNLNMRQLTADSLTAKIGTQNAVPLAGVGDPQASLALSKGKILVAHNNTGKLAIVDTASGALVREVAADWDFPAGAQLRPAALWRHVNASGVVRIFVLHQGLAAETYTPNDTQQIFVLRQIGDDVETEDHDGAAPKTQGIKLSFTNPLGFFNTKSGSPLIVGICYGAPSCKAGVERLDPANLTVRTVLDLAAFPYALDPVIENGPTPTSFYARAYRAGEIVNGARSILRIDAETGKEETVHKFPQDSKLLSLLNYDDSSGRIYVGDQRSDGSGLLNIFSAENSTPVIVNLPAIPGAGVFVAKAADTR